MKERNKLSPKYELSLKEKFIFRRKEKFML